MCQEPVKHHIIEMLAPDGPHESIEISAEQTAPMAALTVFKEQLDAFTCADYYGDAPYDLLARSSQFSWNQYDQFASVLLKAAQAAGVEDGIAEAAIGMYRDVFIGMTGEANDILSAIKAAAANEEYKDKVSVLSIPCGSGKSTALTRLIYDVLRRDNGEGLIIVTDSIERMGEYWKPETENPSFDDELLRFIRWHRNDVAVMNRQNYEQMRIRQHYVPVVVLTTQRYFSWTQERIKELISWQKGTRPLIIFDEAPYLSEERDITVETINVVDSALRMKIEATDEESRKAKNGAIILWEGIRKSLLTRMDQLEYMPDLQYAFASGEESDMLEVFLAYVHEHRSELDTNVLKITWMVEDVVRLLQEWGVYSHRASKTSGKYESKYTVHVDHRDLLTNLGVKVVILDGTADISPMYDENYIHMLSSREYSRSLSYLTIKLCDLPTGESDLRADPVETAKLIRAYLAAATNSDGNLVIFSSEKMEAVFRNLGHDKDRTGHFNNIKGLNSYSAAQNIAQVGVNRKPPVDYLVLDLARSEDVRIQLAEESVGGDMVAAMDNARKALNYSKATMTHHVLADMEQNMYRGIIRNAGNTQLFTYYVFFDHQQYVDLIKEIRNRYTPLGAKVEIVKRSTIEAYKPRSVVEQRIEATEEFLKRWDGSAVKQRAIYSELQMNRADFNNMLTHEKAQRLKQQIEEYKNRAKAAGYPMGWLIK